MPPKRSWSLLFLQDPHDHPSAKHHVNQAAGLNYLGIKVKKYTVIVNKIYIMRANKLLQIGIKKWKSSLCTKQISKTGIINYTIISYTCVCLIPTLVCLERLFLPCPG